MIAWRGAAHRAARAPDRFGAFLAHRPDRRWWPCRRSSIISVVLGLMPTKGIPLPFVSAGGSSLLINLLGMGVLLNVSQHASAVHES